VRSPQEWLEKNAEEVKQVARAAYNRIPDKFLARNQRAAVAACEEHDLAHRKRMIYYIDMYNIV